MATFAKEFEDEEQKKLNSPFCACTQTQRNASFYEHLLTQFIIILVLQ